jgi:hypothetical protein
MGCIAKLSWRSVEVEAEAHSAEDVIRVLHEVDAEYRGKQAIAMQVVRENGESMIIVLGTDHSCLGWWPKDYQGTGSYHTVAEGFDPDLDQVGPHPEVITYYVFGHHTEVPLEYTISKEQAFDAVREFVLSPGRPRSVRWDSD